ncbi:MAG: alpha/beta fold hydrolase [Oculatellaceae cyanobacterium Prado106]|nr:alpha/beta fold hydrolase [Oculatellaceae cyanobacterium Prado106]
MYQSFCDRSWLMQEGDEANLEKVRFLYLIALFTPLSMLSLEVVLGQDTIIEFLAWSLVSCFIAAVPFLVILLNPTLQRSITEPVIFPWLDSEPQSVYSPTPYIPHPLRFCGQIQTKIWRGWQVSYSVRHHPRSKAPVILIHGFGGSIGHWRQNIPELAKHHSVYAVDLLGFGASEKPNVDYSIDLWAEQIYDFWQQEIGEPSILVGNSIGSIACLAIAARYPEMTKGIAMVSLPDTSLHQAAISPAMRPLFNFVQQSVTAIFTSPIILRLLFAILRQAWVLRHWASLAYASKEAITDELLEILSRPAHEKESVQAFGAILKAMSSPQFSPNICGILKQIKIPSLLLWGKQDRMIPISSAARLLDSNPTLEFVELENAGHCAHDEQPELVNAELLSWIDAKVLPSDHAVEAEPILVSMT